MKNLLVFILTIALFSCVHRKEAAESYTSDILKIERITPNTYKHVSHLEAQGFGKVACNGLVFLSKNEAIVFDSPTTNQAAKELINWIQDELNAKIKAIVVSHSHDDCLGGLLEFHRRNIESFANHQTIDFAKKDPDSEIPKNGFSKKLELALGSEKIVNTFFGKGHTYDNIVSYIPSEKMLFGGCIIKSINAKKGYIEEADTVAWPNTVQNIKKAYPGLKYVVPGHGKIGGTELLDYTINLFKEK